MRAAAITQAYVAPPIASRPAWAIRARWAASASACRNERQDNPGVDWLLGRVT